MRKSNIINKTNKTINLINKKILKILTNNRITINNTINKIFIKINDNDYKIFSSNIFLYKIYLKDFVLDKLKKFYTKILYFTSIKLFVKFIINIYINNIIEIVC